MLDINFIKDNVDKVKKGVEAKGYDQALADKALEINGKRLAIINEVEKLRQERNSLGRDAIERGKEIKEKLKDLEPRLDIFNKELREILLQIPNLPSDDVPIGRDESENKVIKKWGEIRNFDFIPKDHLELGELLDIIDVERAAKVSGSRFHYLKNEGALLELALLQYGFDVLIKKGFIPVIPPVLISKESMENMGYLGPDGREDMYILEEDGLVLVGTAEQSIGPMHKDEIFSDKDLPKRYVGFSTAFRREAGSYGKDVRGILRAHQFNKIEMFSYIKPESSDEEHELLLSIEEELMQSLGLPYQVVKMCTGDLGITAIRKYDIETWIPTQNKYRETHSTSNVGDYQARGLNIKYRKQDKTDFVHTLNGTVFSERPIIAILENYQQADGSVKIPQVLQKYTNFTEIKPKNK